MISKLAGIVETITGYLQTLTQQGYLTLDYIFYIGLGLELILIIFFLIKSSFSYELRLDRALDKLNKWLYYNQYIDKENLIAFNNRMRKAPKLLKYHWQQFILYREGDASTYMSNYNCIEKPLRTSSFSANIKNLMSVCWALAIITFTLSLTTYALVGVSNIGTVLLNCLLTPLAIIILNTFFAMLLRSWQNSNLSGLYQNFHLFNRYIDKATTTLPAYIDYEILFTKDEIRRGIPALNEYLEKRSRQEQKELEEAMKNAVQHEEYDFDSLGIDGSQILDRAMKETEIYLNQRQRLLSEIQQLESEIESLKRNYENNQKDYQRKMQASKENVDRLRKQQEESTNRIESNYIRKQQSDEIKKQEQLEKDYESTTLHFNQEYSSLSSAIEERRTELAEKHNNVETSMKAEYETFSEKLYKEIKQDLEVKSQEQINVVIGEKDVFVEELQQANVVIKNQQEEIDKLQQLLQNYEEEIARKDELANKLAGEVEYYNQQLLTQNNYQNEQQPLEVVDTYENQEQAQDEPVYDEYGGYYDSEGYYRYQNGTYYDPDGNYFDEFGGYYDKDGNYYPPAESESQETVQDNSEPNEVVEEQPAESNEIEQQLEEPVEINEIEQSVEEKPADNEEKQDDVVSDIKEQPLQEDINKTEEKPQEEPVYDEFGGYYDNEGYYRYKNGSYYDPEGNYYDTLGGHYDKDGNYFPPAQAEKQEKVADEQPAENNETVKNEKEQSLENETEQEESVENEIDKTEEQPVESKNEQETESVEDDNQESDNAEQEESKPQGKRGRPRKVVDPNTEPKTRAKRGRPRKKVNKDNSQENEQPTAKRGRPKKEVEEPVVNKEPAKRGRPKKETENVEAVENKPAAKRGRPKKEVEESVVNKEPAKRGRPKKETENSETDENKPTAKRGRPKKEAEEPVVNKEPAKRGRPKKEVENTNQQAEPKKKRGRPKKETVSKTELFDELEKLNLQIQQENEKLQQQQAELSQKLDETLSKMDNNETDNNNIG